MNSVGSVRKKVIVRICARRVQTSQILAISVETRATCVFCGNRTHAEILYNRQKNGVVRHIHIRSI